MDERTVVIVCYVVALILVVTAVWWSTRMDPFVKLLAIAAAIVFALVPLIQVIYAS